MFHQQVWKLCCCSTSWALKTGSFPTIVDIEAFDDCLKTAWELTQVAQHQQNDSCSCLGVQKESKKGSFTTIEENEAFGDCQSAWWLPYSCLMTARWLHNYCLIKGLKRHLSDHCAQWGFWRKQVNAASRPSICF